MGWIRLHPIVIAGISACALIGIGVLISSSSFATKPSNDMDSWGKVDGGTLVDNAIVNPTPSLLPHITPDEIYDNLAGSKNTSSDVAIIPKPSALWGTSTQPSPRDIKKPIVFDDKALEELFKFARSSATIPQSITTNVNVNTLQLEDLYSYLPFTLKPWKAAEKQTNNQVRLFDYANTAGSIIETYEDHHRDQAEVLKRFTNDMTDTAKAEEVLLIAQDLQVVGDELANVDDVPEAVRTAHARMAAGYIEMGKLMANVAQARTSTALFDAMVAYNTAADAFAQHFISISTTLQVSEVSFGPNDPGKMFVFTPA